VTGRRAVRVLVAGDDYYASLAVVRGLRKRGYEPWFATYSPLTFAGRSRATAGTFRLPRPTDGDDAYVAALADAAAQCGAAVVLPCNELAIKAVAGREAAFRKGAVVASNTRDSVERATDKARLAELAAAAGVPAPPTIELSLEELDAHRAGLSFPAVVKPAQTAVREPGRTLLAPPAELVHDITSLERALAGTTRRIVQPFLDATLTAVSGVSWQGEVVCSVHQAARRIYPRPLGVSAFAETIPVDATVDAALRAIVGELGWSGIFEFQLLRTATGAHVIDLNPRPYGSLALAIGAGANLPAVWVDLLLGREPIIEPYRVGVRYRAEIREARALVGAITRGRIADALRIARPMRRTVHSVFSMRDPGPLLAVLARGTARLPRPLKG
jgi:predicted ATP-grasp superfamily ATP-dependent carboligase